jgi:hypothetical protein
VLTPFLPPFEVFDSGSDFQRVFASHENATIPERDIKEAREPHLGLL